MFKTSPNGLVFYCLAFYKSKLLQKAKNNGIFDLRFKKINADVVQW